MIFNVGTKERESINEIKGQLGRVYGEYLQYDDITIDGTRYTDVNVRLQTVTVSNYERTLVGDVSQSFGIAQMVSTSNGTLWSKFVEGKALLIYQNNRGTFSGWKTLRIMPVDITVTAKSGWQISHVSTSTFGNLAFVRFTATCLTASTASWYQCATVNLAPEAGTAGWGFNLTSNSRHPFSYLLHTSGNVSVIQNTTNSSSYVAVGDSLEVQFSYVFK